MSNPIITEHKINAPAEKVWKALTDKEEMKVWYFDITDFELEAGKIFNFYEPGEEKKYHHQAEILEILPNENSSIRGLILIFPIRKQSLSGNCNRMEMEPG